jgi:ubiquinone/menaquinone biosynthesis C-methylase UbiE
MRAFLLFLSFIAATHAGAQAKGKQTFCGVSYKKLRVLKEQMKDQFDFLHVHENDTIVDIGAASGWFEGAFGAGSGVDNVHFVLVDVDTGCLNRKKVDAMLQYYSGLKGAPINYSFELVHNTTESLQLPSNAYKKVWIFNVLHEIPDQAKMIRDVYEILQPGGEVVLLEIVPKKKGQLHGGCKKPLMEPGDCTKLFESNGFHQQDAVKLTKMRKHIVFSLMRFVKP